MTAEVFSCRPATRADLRSILGLERATSTAPHWPQRVYEDLLADPSRLTLVIVREDLLAGFLVCHSCGVEAEVETLAVEESLRRQGAGSQLLQAAVAWCQERGVEQIALEVRAGSLAAHTLYARWGFKVAGRRPRYYADPEEDALLMRLDLPAEGLQRAKV